MAFRSEPFLLLNVVLSGVLSSTRALKNRKDLKCRARWRNRAHRTCLRAAEEDPSATVMAVQNVRERAMRAVEPVECDGTPRS